MNIGIRSNFKCHCFAFETSCAVNILYRCSAVLMTHRWINKIGTKRRLCFMFMRSHIHTCHTETRLPSTWWNLSPHFIWWLFLAPSFSIYFHVDRWPTALTFSYSKISKLWIQTTTTTFFLFCFAIFKMPLLMLHLCSDRWRWIHSFNAFEKKERLLFFVVETIHNFRFHFCGR